MRAFEGDDLATLGQLGRTLGGLTLLGDLTCGTVIGGHQEQVACGRHGGQTQHLHRGGRTGFLHVVAVLVEHGADTTVGGAGNDGIADVEGTGLHQHGSHGATALVKSGFDGGATGVGRLDEDIREYAGRKLGLIAANGLVFLRLTEALAQLGPSLPAGLKIATFDDYPWNHVLFGGVTTAAQDTVAIAERVVERLSERIDVVTTTVGEAARLAPKRIVIPGYIEHRASTSR